MTVSNAFTQNLFKSQLNVLKLARLFRPFFTVAHRHSKTQILCNGMRMRALTIVQVQRNRSNVSQNKSFDQSRCRFTASFTSSSCKTKNDRKSSLPKQVKKAIDILNGLKARQRDIFSNFSFTAYQINTAIIELSKIIDNQRGQSQVNNNMRKAQLAQAILDQMEDFYLKIIDDKQCNRKGTLSEKNMLLCPNVITYNAVLNCWAKSKGIKESAINAQSLLDRMISLGEKNHKTQIPSLPIIKPDIISFHTTMDAWANSGDQDAGRKTEELLNRMKQISKQTENIMLKPTHQTYAIVLNSWANSSQFENDNNAAEHATHILFEMIDERRRHGLNDIFDHVKSKNNVDNCENNLSIAAFNSVIKVSIFGRGIINYEMISRRKIVTL